MASWVELTYLQQVIMLRQGGRQLGRPPSKKGEMYERIRNPVSRRSEKTFDGIPSRSQRIIAWRKRIAMERRYRSSYLGGNQ